jgi:large subunit ribosomal protein L3
LELDHKLVRQYVLLFLRFLELIDQLNGERRESRVTNAQKGHFAKAGVAAGRLVQEFRATEADLEGREVGGTIGVDMFTVGQVVDVTGQSKGKGFQGGVKRWNFRTQDATHGNSLSHRVLGSTGQNQTPGRVFKGKKMADHLGAERVTVQGLEIVSIDAERSVLVVKGAIPGATGGDVTVRPTIKV